MWVFVFLLGVGGGGGFHCNYQPISSKRKKKRCVQKGAGEEDGGTKAERHKEKIVRACVRACVRARARVYVCVCVKPSYLYHYNLFSAYHSTNVCVCVRACVLACVRACVRVCLSVSLYLSVCLCMFVG